MTSFTVGTVKKIHTRIAFGTVKCYRNFNPVEGVLSYTLSRPSAGRQICQAPLWRDRRLENGLRPVARSHRRTSQCAATYLLYRPRRRRRAVVAAFERRTPPHPRCNNLLNKALRTPAADCAVE